VTNKHKLKANRVALDNTADFPRLFLEWRTSAIAAGLFFDNYT